jgi:hypothetical protein
MDHEATVDARAVYELKWKREKVKGKREKSRKILREERVNCEDRKLYHEKVGE